MSKRMVKGSVKDSVKKESINVREIMREHKDLGTPEIEYRQKSRKIIVVEQKIVEERLIAELRKVREIIRIAQEEIDALGELLESRR